MPQTYFAILTATGEAKLANATALGTTLQITDMAVGDGNGNTPVPDRTRVALVNQVRRAPLNQLSVDPANPGQVIAEQVIPENVGGWWIREIGLYDVDGSLIAIANCPPTYKPQLAEGSGRTQVVRMVLIVSSTDAVQLKIDPAIVLATRKYADDAITASMNAHLAAADPHPQYLTSQRGDAKINAHLEAADPHPQYKLKTLAILNKNVAGGVDVELTDAEAKNDVLNFSGALTANINVIVPAVARSWTVKNNTTGNFSLTVKTQNGAGLTITQGTTRVPYCDGVDVLSRISDVGTATGDTPPQFDAGKRLATMAALQLALGSHNAATRGYNSGAQLVLTAADIGAAIEFNGGVAQSVKLPPTAGLRVGASVQLVSGNAMAGVTLTSDGGATNIDAMGGLVSSVVLKTGEDARATWTGAAWMLTGSYVFRARQFAASLAANGYAKLPNDYIIQKGQITLNVANTFQTFTFPIAFPNSGGGSQVFVTPITGNTSGSIYAWHNTPTSTGVGICSTVASVVCDVLAVGY